MMSHVTQGSIMILTVGFTSGLTISNSRWTPRAVPLLDSTPVHVLVDDEFTKGSSVTRDAREMFDAAHNRDDRGATQQNFKWEYWNAGSGQYAHFRSPGNTYFSGDGNEKSEDGNALFDNLCELITTFGQQQLGMNAITPPWLSCYVDGHEQRLHTDPAHGPWAFVLSLTSDEGLAVMKEAGGGGGGETQILNPDVLSYWSGFDGYAREEKDLFTLVEPKFGRFLAFDPRFPHGVRQVKGPREMRHGRLVLHGWFSDPQPFFTGGLSAEEAGPALDDALAGAMGSLQTVGRVTGCLSTRLRVCGESGKVLAVDALADSLVVDPADFQGSIGETDEGETIYEDARVDILLALSSTLSAAQFPVASSGENTEITVPFIFE